MFSKVAKKHKRGKNRGKNRGKKLPKMFDFNINQAKAF